jgi:hypothetical protein
MLAAVALREGRYRRALQEIDALLLVDPNDSDGKGSRPLVEVLSNFPDQAVQGASKATVQMDNGKLPLLINGTRASYFFDTGRQSVDSQRVRCLAVRDGDPRD